MRNGLALLTGMLSALGACAKQAPRAADRATAHAGDADCGMRTVWAHPEALPLLTEFVERDARGEFMGHSPWFRGAVTCPTKNRDSMLPLKPVGIASAL